MRWAAVVVAMTRVASASPDYVAADAGFDIGLLSANHAMLGGAFEHHWWNDRAFAEAHVSLGTGDDLRWVEERAGVGLVFHPGRTVDLALGWRVGDTYVTGQIGGAPYATHMLGVDLVVRLSVDLTHGWRLRATPLAPTLYWHTVYGGALALELGVEHAL